MKTGNEALSYREGGGVLEDDGNWSFQISMDESTVGDTMIVLFYDWISSPSEILHL